LNYRREKIAYPKPNFNIKAKPSKVKKEVIVDSKGKRKTQPTRNHDIKCFRCLEVGHLASQCLEKQAIILQDQREIESESDICEDDEMLQFENYSDRDVEYRVKGESLILWCPLNVQIKKMTWSSKERISSIRDIISIIRYIMGL
jgi:hypothetical protein